jgi:hypothetical protein
MTGHDYVHHAAFSPDSTAVPPLATLSSTSCPKEVLSGQQRYYPDSFFPTLLLSLVSASLGYLGNSPLDELRRGCCIDWRYKSVPVVIQLHLCGRDILRNSSFT